MQDISITDVSIESPFQILLKLSLMSLGLLKLPGSEQTHLVNSYDVAIDLSWFPIVLICFSVLAILYGAFKTMEPIAEQTNS
jgi:hypothetical protein